MSFLKYRQPINLLGKIYSDKSPIVTYVEIVLCGIAQYLNGEADRNDEKFNFYANVLDEAFLTLGVADNLLLRKNAPSLIVNLTSMSSAATVLKPSQKLVPKTQTSNQEKPHFQIDNAVRSLATLRDML